MSRAVEHDVLPHFVANRDRVVARAEIGNQRELVGADHRAGRVERRIEDDQPRPRARHSRERLGGDAPLGRFEPHEPCDAPCPLYERQIGVVERLEHHHFVARRDQREDRRGERLGRARGYDHLARIEVEPLMDAVMRGDRRSQCRRPRHRRILIRILEQRARRLGEHILWPATVGKALAEVDRAARPRACRHRFEDRCAKPGK